MPKPLINTNQGQTGVQFDTLLRVSMNQQSNMKYQNPQMDKMKLDRILRKTRSKAYMDAMHKLDVGGHVHNRQQVDEIIDAIKNEFPELEIKGLLLGCVSQCFLGRPYEVHTLDIAGQIIDHYKVGQSLPQGLEKARVIAIRGGYEFIEVYVDCCRAVSANGTVTVIKC